MTRQKKELKNKIDKMYEWIAIDEELGCGFAPRNAYAGMYEEIHKMEEQLARLQHFSSTEEAYEFQMNRLINDDLPW